MTKRTYTFDKVSVMPGVWNPVMLKPKALKVDARNLNEAFQAVMARDDWMKVLPDGWRVRYHLHRVR